jgi:hypothetical protein
VASAVNHTARWEECSARCQDRTAGAPIRRLQNAGQAGVQKKETLAAGSELFVHIPGAATNRALSVFRAPLMPLSNMHSTVLDLAFTKSLRVLLGDGNRQRQRWGTARQLGLKRPGGFLADVGSGCSWHRAVWSATHHPSALWIFDRLCSGRVVPVHPEGVCHRRWCQSAPTFYHWQLPVACEGVWGVVLSLFLDANRRRPVTATARTKLVPLPVLVHDEPIFTPLLNAPRSQCRL